MNRIVPVVLLLAAAQPLFAQAPKSSPAMANPVVGSARPVYEIVKGYLTKAAEQMPEENYAFQPTPEVRTFGQLIGHVANAQYVFCSAALKEDDPHKEDFEKSRTSKAALLEALKASFQYCDGAFMKITDAVATEPIKLFGMDVTRLGTVVLNVSHDFEHYGNIVTYMRMKGMVPPSSQPRPQASGG